ncbi:MAG: hypothetical protein RJA49_2908 [Actinomycetota bacterium]
MASLTLAHTLAAMPGHEVTVHQQGWRLGGKLASARNERYGERIEEHGLHVWSGFYENSFRLIQSVYAQLGRPVGHPLPTWEAAFQPWDNVTWFSHVDASWVRVTNEVPGNALVPGHGGNLAPPAVLMARMLRFGVGLLEGYQPSSGPGLALEEVEVDGLPPAPDATSRVTDHVRWLFDGLAAMAEQLATADAALVAQIDRAAAVVQAALHDWLDELLRDAVQAVPLLLEIIAFTDMALAYLRGFGPDGVYTQGFDAINGHEFTDYLQLHGAHAMTLASGFVRGAYSYIFGFEDGDPTKCNLEAGTTLRMLLRLLLAQCGGVFWKMAAGAGDTVVAPVYQALAASGVTFEFFHVLRSVEVDPATKAVTAVTFGVQATVDTDRVPDGVYRPLRTLTSGRSAGLEVWPAVPDFHQLLQGTALEASGQDLESAWNSWPDVETITLRRGTDFDVLVLGVPVSCLIDVAPQVLASSAALTAAVHAIPTVATQGLQLWMRRDSHDLGAPGPATIATAFAPPLDTWADMSHLIAWEEWPEAPPKSLQYFCGVLHTGVLGAPRQDPQLPMDVHHRAGADALAWLQDNAAPLWPNAVPAGGGFDLGLLYSAPGGDPFASQFWSTNIDPTARYCQSPVGSSAARPAPDGTGIDGLVVVGDWVRTGLGYGCIEAAVMSGLEGAQAISGVAVDIYGATDFPATWSAT